MKLTSENFDSTLEKELKRIDDYYKVGPDNYEVAILGAHKTCLTCIKTHGYSFISTHKFETNDCNSGYLNYNQLSWDELIQKIL